MQFQYLIPIFVTVFLAELGDKTQVAALLFAADQNHSALGVFAAASLALVASTALAVFVGSTAGQYLENVPLKLIAGIGFIGIGTWTILEHFRG